MKLTVKGTKIGTAAVSEVTLNIPGEVSGTKGLPADVLKVVVFSAMMGPEPEPVAATLVVSRVVVFRTVVELSPSL